MPLTVAFRVPHDAAHAGSERVVPHLAAPRRAGVAERARDRSEMRRRARARWSPHRVPCLRSSRRPLPGRAPGRAGTGSG